MRSDGLRHAVLVVWSQCSSLSSGGCPVRFGVVRYDAPVMDSVTAMYPSVAKAQVDELYKHKMGNLEDSQEIWGVV